MTFDWRMLANASSGATRVQDINLYFSTSNNMHSAPIDNYYDHRTKAIMTATPELLNNAPWLSGYILASIISATEFYFRQIFSSVVSICPESQKLSSEKSIHMGAILWHGADNYSKAAFEHFSFAGSEKIKSCSKDFLGYEIKKTSNSFVALEEFDKVCELRHGIVHSGLFLPGKNAVKLQARRDFGNSRIEFDTGRIHEATAICTSLIESYNSELFEFIINRWAIDWRRNPSWNSRKELMVLKKVCALFFSILNSPTTRPSINEVRNKIKLDFGINT